MQNSGEIAVDVEPLSINEIFEGFEDPLAIAVQALARLREHGLPTYIEPSKNEEFSVTMESAPGEVMFDEKVVSMEAYRQTRREPSRLDVIEDDVVSEPKVAIDAPKSRRAKRSSAPLPVLALRSNSQTADRRIAIMQSSRATEADRQAAFGSIFEEYKPQLIRYAAYMMGNKTAGEDIVQDAFVGALIKIDSFECYNESSLSSWLYTIVRNASLNALRSSKNKPHYSINHELFQEGPSPHMLTNGSPEGDPAKLAELRETYFEKLEILEGLPPRQREAMVLSLQDRFTYEQMAEILDTSVPAIKSLLTRGREHLAKHLSKRTAFVDVYADDEAAQATVQ